MAVQTPHNAFKDVSHVVKFNGENYSDYRCEFLGMMEQLGLKTMLDAPTGGQIESLPATVSLEILTISHTMLQLDLPGVTHSNNKHKSRKLSHMLAWFHYSSIVLVSNVCLVLITQTN